jgi:hypothetical protein
MVLDFEQNLVSRATDTSTKYVTVDRPVNGKRVPGTNAQLEIPFEFDFEAPERVSI